jgi:hypothetical protein
MKTERREARMMLRSGTAIALAVLLLGSVPAWAADTTTTFLQTHYYLLSLGQIAADVDSVRTAAQSSGFSLVAYDGDSAQAFRGDDPVIATVESVLSDERLLVVDSGRFLLRQPGDGFGFSVRPTENGYELVIDPLQDLSMSDVLGSVLAVLHSMGILGSEVHLNVQAYAKDVLKGPPPPAGVAIESTLYSLLVARDWFGYATMKGLTLVGLRVEIVAELLPGASLAEPFAAYVVEEVEGLAKLSLPIDQLLALARSSAVGYVRAPYHPSVP